MAFLGSRPESDREPGYHPSGLAKLCPRRETLSWLYPKDEEPFPPKLLMTFDVGHAVHDWWQNKYLGPMGILVGKWRCLKCGKLHGTNENWVTMPRRGRCACKGKVVYEEIGLRDPTYGIVGHADGVLRLPGGDRLFELKTINDYGYGTLLAPKSAHRYQTNIYMKLLGLEKVTIVYVNKGKTGALKEFEVEFSERLWRDVLWRIDKTEELKRDRDEVGASLDLVDRTPRICDSDRCEMARWCPYATECFERETTVEYKP